MKIGEAESWLRKQLEALYEEGERESIAALVMEHLTGLSRTERIFKKEEPLDVHQLHNLTQIMGRLQTHEPPQYVLGRCWFDNLPFFVDKSVLIPRPETEELVAWVVQDVAAKGLDVFESRLGEADATTTLKILDVGTGSGCIALSLKKRLPRAEVWGCDVSEQALNIARRNGSELNIRVDFQGINFLDEAQQSLLPTVDIIVSNPPYIPLRDAAGMHPNVLEHEPHLALFVPDNDALVFYRALARFGQHRLYENGALYAEIHEDLGAPVIDLFRQEGYTGIELKKDMQGKDRMVKAVKTQP